MVSPQPTSAFSALLGLLLIAFAPILWIFTQSSNSLPFVGFLALVVWLLSFLLASSLLRKLTKRSPLLLASPSLASHLSHRDPPNVYRSPPPSRHLPAPSSPREESSSSPIGWRTIDDPSCPKEKETSQLQPHSKSSNSRKSENPFLEE